MLSEILALMRANVSLLFGCQVGADKIKDRIVVRYINDFGEEEAGIDAGGLFKVGRRLMMHGTKLANILLVRYRLILINFATGLRYGPVHTNIQSVICKCRVLCCDLCVELDLLTLTLLLAVSLAVAFPAHWCPQGLFCLATNNTMYPNPLATSLYGDSEVRYCYWYIPEISVGSALDF